MITATQALDVMRSWLGYSEANGKFKQIIDLYNTHKPLARGYKVKYSDEWCATCISAVFIKLGATALVGTECSVQRYIDIFKSKGIWNEDGTITPVPGDIICYNWDDKTQPNDGWADHIGIVEHVANKKITVIEGNKGEAVARRIIAVGHGHIRGYARPKYRIEEARKTNQEVAKEVIAGKWGNGQARKAKLEAAGYNYPNIQALVNQQLAQRKVDLTKIAIEVANGQWGNGEARRQKLEAAGYNYDDIQAIVNELYYGAIKKGDRVKVKRGARNFTNKKLNAYVYNNTYTVIQVDGDRVVIGQNNIVTAAVHKDNLIKI